MLQFFDFERASKVYADIAMQAEKLGLQIETDHSAVGDRKGDKDSGPYSVTFNECHY